jgi:two-component system cell cycle response regulator DivK
MDVMQEIPVLVVDDDAHALAGYLEFLADAGFAPVGAPDGDRALALALLSPPAAVITDISLPGMNGFALAQALQFDTRTRHVPVIGLTGHWSTEIHARAASVHMSTVLLKPCAPDHLVAELRRVLTTSKAG